MNGWAYIGYDATMGSPMYARERDYGKWELKYSIEKVLNV